MRICSETGENMREGWYLCDDIYLKYQKDVDNYLLKWSDEDGLHHLDISWLRDYYFENDMYYWTTWYDE